MAELQAGNVDAGQTSDTGGDPYITILMDNVKGDDLVDVTGMLNSLDQLFIETTAGDREDTKKPRIPRVPEKLREKQYLKNFFEPRVVSLGPYYHNQNSNLKVNKEMKIKLAKIFMEKHGVNRERVCRMIKSEIKDLKDWYEADATGNYNDDELALMFLIDGCVVLHFMDIACGHNYTDETQKLEGWECELAGTCRLAFQIDMMLLENQLPYQVLQCLIFSSKEREKLEKLVRRFICSLMNQPEEKQELKQDATPSYHLLHSMWTSFTSVETRSSNFKLVMIENSSKIIGMALYILVWIIANLFAVLLPKPTTNLPVTPRIEEMKEGGVMFKFNDTGSIADISFSSGILELPSVTVDEATPFSFFNLIAFEASSNFSHRFEVSSYIYFIASLVGQPQDVEVLKDSKILRSQLDSDKEVVELFKNLSANLEGAFIDNYHDIIEQIRTHCKKKYNFWIAQLKTTYFQSPWTVIALLAVIISFLFSFLQALYSILGNKKG